MTIIEFQTAAVIALTVLASIAIGCHEAYRQRTDELQ
jgi:Tfp pilus assembly protein PilE